MSSFVGHYINFLSQGKEGVVDFKEEKTIIIIVDDEVVVLLRLSKRVTYLLGGSSDRINVGPSFLP